MVCRCGIVVAVLMATSEAAFAQDPSPAASAPAAWSFSASAYTYVLPDDDNYVQPTIAADRGALHLEARYNYENINTASAWVGYNFGGGESVEWTLTPMLGGVFGDTAGVAPGYKASVTWRKLDFYSEGELVIDAGDRHDSFLYNWSELALAPIEALRVGLVTQRTRAYQSDRDIQRGILVGYSRNALAVTGYVLNPDDEPMIVLAVALSF